MCWKRPKRTARSALKSTFPASGGDAYLLVAQARLDHQMSTWDALDSKANNHLVTAVAEAGFLLTLLAIKLPKDHTVSCWSTLALVLAAVGAVAVVVVAWIAQRVQEIKSYPNPAEAWKVAHLQEPVEWELARSLETAYDLNVPLAKHKASFVQASGYCLLGLTAVSILAAFAIVFTR